MDEATREQQREARRQKVLARSHGERPPIVDLATQQNEIAPEGVTAELVDPPDQDTSAKPGDPSLPLTDQSGKSASRLAAERRRRRIMESKNERMAKVHGGRAVRGGDGVDEGAGASGQEAQARGKETLDDMLETAEAEFFGQRNRADVAEAKPTAVPRQTFKSIPSAGAGASQAPSPAAAQSKAVDRTDAVAGSRRRPSSGVSSRTTTARRSAGNKALDSQPFDLAAVESLAGTSASQGTGSSTGTEFKRVVGGLRLWAGLERVTRMVLLLLLGAGVGGLLLPQGRAAVAQAKFEVEYLRTNAGMDSRSRLEAFLSERDRVPHGFDVEESPNMVDEVVDADLAGVKFEGVSSTEGELETEREQESSSEGWGAEDDSWKVFGGECAMDGVCGERPVVRGREGVAEPGGGDVLDDIADGGVTSEVISWFLIQVDRLVSWAHYFSTAVVPIGWVNGSSCVPAFVLAVLVRLVVATIFAAIKGALGLPAFSQSGGSSKPGIMMGMLLTAVPSLGKVIAFCALLKDLFADTTLVVVATVLTLAFCLGSEQETGAVGYAGSLLGGVGRFMLGGHGDSCCDHSLKEL